MAAALFPSGRWMSDTSRLLSKGYPTDLGILREATSLLL